MPNKDPPQAEMCFQSLGMSIHCAMPRPPSHNNNLIMLHGLASNATRWCEFMSSSALIGKSNLLAMNLRGHGHSMTLNAFTRKHWCTDLDRLLKQLPHPSILMGHSMGAQIALDYASQQPAHVAGLVLIDPVFPQALTGTLAKVARLRWLLYVAIKIARLGHRLGIRKSNYPYRNLQRLDEQTREFLANNPDKGIADLYMNPFVDLEFMPVANYLQDLFEVTRKLPDISTIDVPVLVLLSSGASTSQVEQNKILLSALTKLAIKIIDADHWLLTEQPQQAREIIDEWCSHLIARF